VPVEQILLGQKPAQQAAGIFGPKTVSQMVGIPSHTTFSVPLSACRITAQTLTGNPPST
jgi:hypothetical protein